MTTKEMVKAICEHAGKTMRATALYIGITPQIFYDINGGKIQTLSPAVRRAILTHFPEINPSWLLSGEGVMLCNEIEEQHNTTTQTANNITQSTITQTTTNNKEQTQTATNFGKLLDVLQQQQNLINFLLMKDDNK